MFASFVMSPTAMLNRESETAHSFHAHTYTPKVFQTRHSHLCRSGKILVRRANDENDSQHMRIPLSQQQQWLKFCEHQLGNDAFRVDSDLTFCLHFAQND